MEKHNPIKSQSKIQYSTLKISGIHAFIGFLNIKSILWNWAAPTGCSNSSHISQKWQRSRIYGTALV